MKDCIINFLKTNIDPSFVILFGSYATGNIHPKSDIDIAFYKQNCKLTPYDIFVLSAELSSLLNIEKVDLINLEQADTVFKVEIVYKGELIYCNDDYVYDTFCMTAYSMYARFNEERKVVVDAILESGRVYE